jgi:uncharacterized protein (DUF2147 family)
MNILFYLAFLCTSNFSLPIPVNPDDIIGTWLNEEGTGKIEIFKKGDEFFGKLIWLKEPIYTQKDVDDNDHPYVKLGAEKVDFKNPDESKQSLPLIGQMLLREFKYDIDNEEWSGGRIYDPKNGKDYKCYLQLVEQNKLKVRGYIGFSLLGRTTYWTRL